ncbi:esterase/lipase/thioesterase family active site (plasmid) [Calothrix parasitica NIES-267]|uniref:Esterase/lipase/thioesterase family active site n=1 Tax=Calothrix parasitica NIES-267 TaxID=1973488 RepID=A0A1Z4M383_9CYAN|nr:esterase/lipase/thioesterase family active site [Calothrix parasitica NIES-267]
MPVAELKKLPITEIKQFDYSTEFFTNTFLKIENEEERRELIEFYKSRSSKVNVFEFFYTSNNHRVKGILVEPAKLIEPASTLIYCRGGTGVVGSLTPIHFLSKKIEIFDLVNSGHIVIASQLSGIDGGVGMTDVGGQSDIDDVMNLYQSFQNYELGNGNFGLIGGSNGGSLVYKMLTRSDDFKCAVVVAGKTKDFGNTDRPDFEKLKALRHQYYNTESEEELNERSPIIWAHKISKTTPILLIHGTKDWRVSVSDTLEMATKLIQNNTPIGLRIYEGDNHSLTVNRKKVNQEIIDWVQTYL